jgi:hypothetical protein
MPAINLPDAAQYFNTALTVTGTVVAALIAGIVSFTIARPKTKVDVQTAINAGFTTLITELQEERVELLKIIREQTEQIKILSSRVSVLDRHVTVLNDMLRAAGLSPPEHPAVTTWQEMEEPGQ